MRRAQQGDAGAFGESAGSSNRKFARCSVEYTELVSSLKHVVKRNGRTGMTRRVWVAAMALALCVSMAQVDAETIRGKVVDASGKAMEIDPFLRVQYNRSSCLTADWFSASLQVRQDGINRSMAVTNL